MLLGNSANSTPETRVGDVVQFVQYNQTNASMMAVLGEKTTQGLQRLSSAWSSAQKDLIEKLNGVPTTTEEEEKTENNVMKPVDGSAEENETQHVDEEP